MGPRRYLLAAALALAACQSPTQPFNDGIGAAPQGRLSGTVTIGPNCPVESDTNPCLPSPEAYQQRKILVYDEAKSSLLYTLDIDTRGAYGVDLAPGKYTIDFKGSGIDRSGDVPKTVEIHSNSVTTLNVAIDTGLR